MTTLLTSAGQPAPQSADPAGRFDRRPGRNRRGRFRALVYLDRHPRAGSGGPGDSGGRIRPPPASFDGSCQVNGGLGSISDFSSSWVGYRVQEQLAGVGGHTAVGRSPKVTGTITLAGSTVTAVSITADLTVLASESSQRDDQLRRQAIETDAFPTTTFALTQPIALGSLPADGVTVSATATGDLTIHGVTKSVQISVQAQRQGGIIAVAGSIPIVFGDYGFEGPSSFAVVSVNDHGIMELHLLFTRGN
jgi:polyisoprenoid-binding protein YceI